MLVPQAVAVKRFHHRDHHAHHHHGEGQGADDHGVLQGLEGIRRGPGVACDNQGTDHQGQDDAPDDAMLDARMLLATGHDGVHDQDAGVRGGHQEGHDQHHAHDGDSGEETAFDHLAEGGKELVGGRGADDGSLGDTGQLQIDGRGAQDGHPGEADQRRCDDAAEHELADRATL